MKSLIKEWEHLAQIELKRQDISQFQKSLYTPLDLERLPKDFLETLPGIFPYTRGPRATMYANQPWTLRQYGGFGSAKDTNAFYHEGLKGGQKGLSVAFDLPTHRGYDSDHEKAQADVGAAGVAIDSVEDMKILFDRIPLDQVSVSMTMNGAVLPVFAAFLVMAQEQNVPFEKLSGTLQNDILKEFLVRNTYIYPPKPSMRMVGDIISYCSKYMPSFNPISISGYHIHEAGADLALELGLTLANGLEYVRLALSRGLSIDAFAPRLSFFFATGMQFYSEIAKLRAARFLWAHLLKPFAPNNKKSLMLRTHCQTSGWSLQAKGAYNNIIRTTIEAMASILGGTQSLHTNSFDEALALPTPKAAQIARNTQLILQHETGIPHIIDPFAGSYAMETLTYEMVKKAKSIIDEIESHGGMQKAIEEGLPQGWILKQAALRQAQIDSGKEKIIGVNFYPSLEEEIPVLEINNQEILDVQLKSLQKLKQTRNESEVKKSLEALKRGAQDKKANLLELSMLAMGKRATLGEVSLALEQVFSRHEAGVQMVQGVYKKQYAHTNDIENIRQLTDDFYHQKGRRPRILVAKVGQDGHDRGAKAVASAFADFGFDVDLGPLFQTPKEVLRQALDHDVDVLGISTLAGAHKTLIPQVMDLLKAKNASVLVVVGGVIPPKDETWLKAQGVSLVFGPGSSLVNCAKAILDELCK